MFAATFAAIAAGFTGEEGPLFPAAVVTETPPVIDDGGSIVTPGVPSERPCSAQVDVVTDAMRREDGFADKDVRLILIGLDGGLDTFARVEVQAGPSAGLYSVQSVQRDPVSVGFDCRARVA